MKQYSVAELIVEKYYPMLIFLDKTSRNYNNTTLRYPFQSFII